MPVAALIPLAARLIAPMVARSAVGAVAARGASMEAASLAGRVAGQATIATGQYAHDRVQARQEQRRGLQP